MITFEGSLEPLYFEHFHCIASRCQDTCCVGWDIGIDKTTYMTYSQCNDATLRSLFEKYIVINDSNSTDDSIYSQIAMNDYICPFLTEEKLCFIQKSLGEKSLSMTCSTYPRTYNEVYGVLERSLSTSCPVAAELILLNEEPMRFKSTEACVIPQNSRISALMTEDCTDTKPYRYFHQIRSYAIELLQNRTYPLWQRLVILSLFCSRLDKASETNNATNAPYLITEFNQQEQAGTFTKLINDIVGNPGIQLQAMKILIEHRLQGSYVSEKFLACVDEFKKGIGDDGNASQETVASRYVEAYSAYYQPFIEKHEYIMENYLVNYIFKNLFPFGRKNSIHYEPKTIYEEYVLLVIHYSLIKTLLIGIAGYQKQNFGIEHVVTLIQTFSKAIEHNQPFLNRSVQFMKESEMDYSGGMIVLIKN